MKVFVTVGSTCFEALIQKVISSDFKRLLESHNYDEINIQFGSVTPLLTSCTGYAYKASLRPDMEHADLIISHAGSGSILEALEMGKLLIVVVNEELADNHQSELATALENGNYLVQTSVTNLELALERALKGERNVFPKADASLFVDSIRSSLGFDKLT